MNLNSGDFVIRRILHAGEGPVDESPCRTELVLNAYTRQRAVEALIEDLVQRECGRLPKFGDGGADKLIFFLAIDDAVGRRACYRVTASIEIKVKLDVISTPARQPSNPSTETGASDARSDEIQAEV